MEFKYEFESSKNLNKKVSVSEVKRRHMIEDLDDDFFEDDDLTDWKDDAVEVDLKKESTAE